ncbi:hypothetical protein [Amycolatopsis speibonae]|uniref:Uncharacterized protein n=1 Tax=Amycolatopsis speibonae TaxID=1450224 RepID=A0ABV7PE60_9PSEU
MSSQYRYVERRIPLAVDVVATVAALARDWSGSQVVYESNEKASWAAGELASVEIRATGATLIRSGQRQEFTGPPLAMVTEALAAAGVEEWRAYGWAAFELSHVLHNTGTPDGVLGHLMIPCAEIRLDGTSALLRAGSASEVDELMRRLSEAVFDEPPNEQRITVDLDDGSAPYRAAVATAVERIRAGELEKVILSRVVPVDGELDLAGTYRTG